jgi:hypothetical protein
MSSRPRIRTALAAGLTAVAALAAVACGGGGDDGGGGAGSTGGQRKAAKDITLAMITATTTQNAFQ